MRAAWRLMGIHRLTLLLELTGWPIFCVYELEPPGWSHVQINNISTVYLMSFYTYRLSKLFRGYLAINLAI